MQPNKDDDQTSRDRHLQVPPRDQASVHADDRQAAADYMRREIDRIYEIENEEVAAPDTTQPAKPAAAAAPADTYKRSHSEAAAHTKAAEEHAAYWKRYHSAWQSYYQQYYERYYLSQLAKSNQASETNQVAQQTTPEPATEQPEPKQGRQEFTRDQAIGELREQLLGKVSTGAGKLRRSRHFMPIVAAFVIAILVLLAQYNGLLVAQVKAYVSPSSVDPGNLIVNPTTSLKVGPKPLISIPKIGVQAPVIYDVTSLKENYIQNKLKNGVVHYPIPGASSVPGQDGNTVIIGHSSNDVFNDGDYKFIFVQLDRLQKGDIFYLNYKGTRYTYSVTKKEVILPTQVNKLVLPTTKPMATLITCTPPGTAWKRLAVFAEQISPDPAKAKSAEEPSQTDNSGLTLPNNSPSLLEKLFGA